MQASIGDVTPLQDDMYLQHLPGCGMLLRLRCDDAWLGALDTALEWASDSGACTLRELEQGLHKILDSYTEFSRFERTVIFDIATSKRQA